MTIKRLTISIAIIIYAMSAIVAAQDDPVNETDTVTIYWKALGERQWLLSAHLWNDEDIAALDIPIQFTAGVAPLVMDSISYENTRMEGFAQKYNPVDAKKQEMHFGGMAYMGPVRKPLKPGNGEIARIYISVRGDKKPGPFAVDTTTIAPNSTLMLVDINAAIIIPAFKIVHLDEKKK